jgi:hypothetical protein
MNGGSMRLRPLNNCTQYEIACPACGVNHSGPLSFSGEHGAPVWNLDTERPSLGPEITIHGDGGALCRFAIQNGRIAFSPDSTHNLAGKMVALELIAAPQAARRRGKRA